jgi:hypothetical protein
MTAREVRMLRLGVIVPLVVAVMGSVKVVEVAVIEVSATCRKSPVIAEARIEVAVDMTIESVAMMPRSSAEKDAAVEPLRPIVAIRRTVVRSIAVVAISTHRRCADVDSDRNLRAGRRNGADQKNGEYCDEKVLQTTHRNHLA